MKILKQFMELYTKINNIYLELYSLELDGEKDSVLFLGLINELKKMLVMEESLFKTLYNSSEYCDTCEYVSLEDNPMFMRLRDYINTYENTNFEIYPDDDDETVNEMKLLDKVGKMYSACNKSIFLVYLSFLEECICANDYLKERLLNLKYYNSFTKHDMESILVSNNFSIDEVNYVDLYLRARLLNIDIRLRDEIILDSCFTTIIGMVDVLLSINDNDRDNDDKMALSLNAECLLRGCLSLLSDRDYKKIKNKIFDRIKEFSNDKNMISVNLVNIYIDNRMKDKVRVRKLSSGVIPE